MKRKGGASFRSGFQSAGPRRRVRAPFRAPRRIQPVVFARQNIRIGGFTGMENKFLDTELILTAITTAWTPLNPTGTGATDTLSVPAQGNGESQRIGRVYTINSVMVKGQIVHAGVEGAAAPIPDVRTRIIVYWDKQTNSSEATATEIMDAGGQDDLVAFRNLQNTHRFRVLWDKSFLLRFNNQTNEGAVDKYAAGLIRVPFKMFHTFKGGLKVQTDGTTANVTSCTDNNLGVAAISDAGTSQVQMSYGARIRFSG